MKGEKTGGRVAGTPNKSTAEIKEIARGYGPKAIALLWKLAGAAESDAAKVAALKEILDRGYGKATQLIGGDPDSKPIAFSMIEMIPVRPKHDASEG